MIPQGGVQLREAFCPLVDMDRPTYHSTDPSRSDIWRHTTILGGEGSNAWVAGLTPLVVFK